MSNICQSTNEKIKNLQVISLYIQLMRNEDHLLHREGGSVYLENTWFSQLLRGDGEQDESKLSYTQDDVVETRVQNYLDVDMVGFTI
jgi:hypothetical protein